MKGIAVAVVVVLLLFAWCAASSPADEVVVVGSSDVPIKYSERIQHYIDLTERGECGKTALVDTPNQQRWEALPQTPNRLLQQMHRHGYSEEDLELTSKCLSLNVRAFGSAVRRSGRTYSAHCIGTAGALVLAGKPVEQICAAAIHSIYAFGDTPGVTRCELNNMDEAGDCADLELFKQERRRVAALTSAEIERLVSFYQLFPTPSMGHRDVQLCNGRMKKQGVESFGELGKWSIAMHVANELDEYVHWDSIVGPSRNRPLATIVQFLELAEGFGEDVLAEGLYYSYSQFLLDKEMMGRFRSTVRPPRVKDFPSINMFEALTAIDGRLAY